MASPSVPQHEPTMEEILASIRKIISEDSEAQPAAAQAEPEVLELTQEVREEAVAAPAPAPVAAAAPAPVVMAAPAPQPAPAKPADDVIFQPKDPEPVPASGIFSESTRRAFDTVSEKFVQNEPAPLPPRNTTAPVAPHDGATLEALFDRAVRETFEPVLQAWLSQHAPEIVERMKPAIAEWMDKNFPPMLSAAVEAEFVRTRRQH